MWKRALIVLFLVSCILLIMYLSIEASMDYSTFSQPAFMPDPLQKANQTVRRVRLKARLKPKLPKFTENQAGLDSKNNTQISRKRPRISREGPEIRQVIFAKVHKAASSTMQNIFLRFSLARNLSVLLPKTLTSISEHGSYFRREDVVPHPQGKKFYDILCSHVIYNEQQLSDYFPDYAVRVAIVREPLKQSLSALKYYINTYPTGALMRGFHQHKEDPINGYLRNPHHFSTFRKDPAKSHVNNRMSVDLGFDLDKFEQSKRDKRKIHAFLQQVENQFDVVLVSDYFDESLILMRRILRWTLKDIIYLKVNTAKSQSSEVWRKRPIFNSTIFKKFEEWDEIDFQLYDHFLKIFLKTIQSEPDFQEELKAFRLIQMDVKYFCLYDETAEFIRFPKSKWTDSFVQFREDCLLMSTDEVGLTNKARQSQIERYKAFTKERNINDVIGKYSNETEKPKTIPITKNDTKFAVRDSREKRKEIGPRKSTNAAVPQKKRSKRSTHLHHGGKIRFGFSKNTERVRFAVLIPSVLG